MTAGGCKLRTKPRIEFVCGEFSTVCRRCLGAAFLIRGMIMSSKYDTLWKWICDYANNDIKLSYDEIEKIAGIPIDHSFLKFKKELIQYDYEAVKISIKDKTVLFRKIN